jgi:nitroreductase
MDVIEAVLKRHSVRDFKPEPVAKATLVKILESATRSPSAGNSQPWEIFVASGKTLERIRQSYLERFQQDISGKPEFTITPLPQWPAHMQERMNTQRAERFKLLGIDLQDNVAIKANMENGSRLWGAPVLIVICMDHTLMLSSAYDIGLLTQNILLAAQNYNVGSIVAMGLVAHPDILHKELEIPDSLRIVIGVALGYQDEKSVINSYRSSRRPIQEVIRFKGF